MSKNGDGYIRRYQVRDMLHAQMDSYGVCIDEIDVLLDANDKLFEIPAADVAPVVHGRWEVVKGVFTPGGDPLLRCPICKSRESEHLCGIESRVNWNYCPNCGAKMDNPETTDDL